MKRVLITLFAAVFCLAGFGKPAKTSESYEYQRAVELMDQRQYKEGIEWMNKELNNNPKNGNAYVWMTVAYANLAEYGKAMTAANYALQYTPKKQKVTIAYVYALRGQIYLELEDTVSGLADYTQAIKIDPTDYEYYENRADVYFEAGQYDLGNADYLRMMKMEPGNSTGYMGYGRNLRDQGKLEEAIAQFTYAAKLDTENPYPYAWRADCYIRQKKYEEAVDDLIHALDIDDNGKAAQMLATIDKEGFDLAAARLKVQLAKNPNISKWYTYAAWFYEEHKMYKKAIELYKQAKVLNADVWYDAQIAGCYDELGDYTNALKYAYSVYEADTTDAGTVMSISYFYSELDSLETAINWAGKAIALAPDEGRFYYRRGRYLSKLNRIEEAIEDYTMAITLDSKDAWALMARGRLYQGQGKEELARKDFEKAIALEPKPTESACAQYSYLFMGDTTKAVEYMDSVLTKYPGVEKEYDAVCIYSLIGDTTTALDHLRKAFEAGFRRFAVMRRDDDLATLHEAEGYQALYDEYWDIYQAELQQYGESEGTQEEVTYEVPFTAANGVTKVECTINGLPLNFIFDTGASTVTISQTEANFMYKNGYLTQKDVVGKAYYQTADGNISEGTTFMLNRINFGGLELTGVRASVVANQKAPLLLGQTVLQRLGKIEIDNEKRVLRITTRQ